MEALDRLRATDTVLPVEADLARHLRGTRYYQEESRHGLPIIPDPDGPAELPPTTTPPLEP